MKKLLLSILMLFSVCMLCSCSKTYKSEANGYSFTYDSEWKSVEAEPGTDLKIVTPGRDDVQASLSIRTDLLDNPDITLEELNTVYSEEIDYGVVTVKNVVMDGAKGCWMSVEPEAENKNVDFTKPKKDLIFVKNDEKVYVFILEVVNHENYDIYRQKADELLTGFKLG